MKEVDRDLGNREQDPDSWREEADRLRRAHPTTILFLCVANSARSQMAEGIARSLAPREVRISSAGSVPMSVRPEAVAVLREIDVDISNAESKHVDDLDTADVDAVITLCREEACPVYLGAAIRLHWALPDPASVTGSDELRLEAYREVRDTLRRRLTVLFSGWPAGKG